ncbi:chloramphenicol resistance protein [uncultured Clostridium sp.]|uniref:chloramphenicol resistance protein n=1 Tax=uncultured Clostridium sp. TaxID=59620 RepID=UPI0025E7854C|nr:chloramphenicol resistance protein [uncultured Clostridium sp.]
MIIKSLRDYISQCPYLYEFNKGINIDYLDNNSTTYSIEEVPCEPIIKRYINGDTKRQYDFIFASRESYGADVFQNIENSGFYEDFSSWIEEESSKGNLPSLEGNRESLEIKVSTTGYAFQTDDNSARYQIQLKLIYFQKGGF